MLINWTCVSEELAWKFTKFKPVPSLNKQSQGGASGVHLPINMVIRVRRQMIFFGDPRREKLQIKILPSPIIMGEFPLAPAQSWLNNQDPQLPRCLASQRATACPVGSSPRPDSLGNLSPIQFHLWPRRRQLEHKGTESRIERENPLIPWPALPYEYRHKWDGTGSKKAQWKTQKLDSLDRMNAKGGGRAVYLSHCVQEKTQTHIDVTYKKRTGLRFVTREHHLEQCKKLCQIWYFYISAELGKSAAIRCQF